MDINEIIKQAVEEVLSQVSGNIAASQAASVCGGGMAPKDMAKYIDHTLLKPQASKEQIKKLCDEAKANRFASVCVNTCNVKYAAELLEGTGVTPCVVVGFPLGAMTTEAKAFEAKDAISKGAREVDMVINVGAIKSGDWDFVYDDIKAVADVCKSCNVLLKVIIETCLLTNEEKVKACKASKHAGADFVKTSTGFSTGGATVEDVELMRATVGPDMGVKASGGVKTYEDAVKMIKAGANRLGTSSGIDIVTGKASAEHKCVNCGRCKSACPTGNATIINNNY